MRDTDTGRTAVVGVDGIARPCHLLTEQEFQFVTNMVFKWCAYMNSTKEGRTALHGKKDGGVTVTTNGVGAVVKRQAYEDGYVHEETLAVNRPRQAKALTLNGVPVLPPKPRAAPIRHPAGISQKQKEMREARERIRNGKPKEITINHDANTGKDTVVK